MTTVTTASQTSTTVVVSENGGQGLPGVDGSDGSGFNQVRKSKIDNPLCHLFKTNKLVEASAPTGTDSDVTWTRSTAATYVDRYGIVKTAVIDEPREEAKGFLIEGTATNQFLYSEDFTNAAWLKTAAGAGTIPTITANFSTSPDGTVNADRVVMLTNGSTSSDISDLTQTLALDSYTGSFWIKSNTSAATVYIVSDTGGQELKNITTEWQRFSSTYGSTDDIKIRIRGSQTAESVDLSVWGAQAETTEFTTSNIVTTSAPVPRGADIVSLSGINNASLLSGSSTIAFTASGLGVSSSDQYLVTAFADDNLNRSFIFRRDGNGVSNYISGSSNLVTADDTTAQNVFVSTYNEADLLLYSNGVISDTLTAAYIDSADKASNIYIGSRSDGTFPMYGHIKDLKVYDFTFNSDEAIYLS